MGITGPQHFIDNFSTALNSAEIKCVRSKLMVSFLEMVTKMRDIPLASVHVYFAFMFQTSCASNLGGGRRRRQAITQILKTDVIGQSIQVSDGSVEGAFGECTCT